MTRFVWGGRVGGVAHLANWLIVRTDTVAPMVEQSPTLTTRASRKDRAVELPSITFEYTYHITLSKC
jgi:hypothetical protein